MFRTIKAFWDSRRAKWAADALRYTAEARRTERRVALSQREHLTPAERKELTLLEADGRWVGTTDYLTPWRDRLDQLIDFQRGGIGLGVLHRHSNGSDFPFFANETELDNLRSASRLLVKTDPNADGLLGGLRRYTIGTGSTIEVKPRASQYADVAKQAQEVVDEFDKRNRWCNRERWFFTRSHRDGEGILRLFPNDDGLASVRFVWPECVRQPLGTDEEEWGFGRQVDPDDVEITTAWAIHPTYDTSGDPEIVKPEEVVYLGINADPGVRRSHPDFVWGMSDSFSSADKLVRNMGEGSAQQAAIAYIMQHVETMPREAIRSFADADASYNTVDTFTGNDIRVRKARAGTVVHTNKNTQFVDSPYNAGISGHIDVAKMLLRRAAQKYNAPEWLVNSDASSNSYANALAAESPFFNSILELQDQYQESFRDLYERVVTIAAAAGRLPKNVLDVVEIVVALPSPKARDRAAEANAAKAEIEAGYLSPQIAAEEAGREWKRIERDRKAVGLPPVGSQPTPPPQPPGMGGMPPGGTPPQGPPDQGPPPSGTDVDPASILPPELAGAFESVLEAADPNFTGVSFGKYFIAGKEVSADQYHAQAGKQPASKPAATAAATPPPMPKTKKAKQELAKAKQQEWLKAMASIGINANTPRTPEVKALETSLVQALGAIQSGKEMIGPGKYQDMTPEGYAGMMRTIASAIHQLSQKSTWGVKEAIAPETDGVYFGRYYINGKRVTPEQYHAERGDKTDGEDKASLMADMGHESVKTTDHGVSKVYDSNPQVSPREVKHTIQSVEHNGKTYYRHVSIDPVDGPSADAWYTDPKGAERDARRSQKETHQNAPKPSQDDIDGWTDLDEFEAKPLAKAGRYTLHVKSGSLSWHGEQIPVHTWAIEDDSGFRYGRGKWFASPEKAEAAAREKGLAKLQKAGEVKMLEAEEPDHSRRDAILDLMAQLAERIIDGDEDAQDELDALADLAAGGDLQEAWVDHGTSKTGKKRWKDDQTGKIRYQESKPGEAREKRDRSHAKADATIEAYHLHRNAPGEHPPLTAEQWQDLADHMPGMTRDKLRNVRNQLLQGVKDQKRHADWVEKLRAEVANRLKPEEKAGEEKPEKGNDSQTPDSSTKEPWQMTAKDAFESAYAEANTPSSWIITNESGKVVGEAQSQSQVDRLKKQYKATPSNEWDFQNSKPKKKDEASESARKSQQYDNFKARHRAAVESALASSKPVPPEVLADYPDLAPKAPAAQNSTADLTAGHTGGNIGGVETTPPQEDRKMEPQSNRFKVTAKGRDFDYAVKLLKKRGAKYNPEDQTWTPAEGSSVGDDYPEYFTKTQQKSSGSPKVTRQSTSGQGSISGDLVHEDTVKMPYKGSPIDAKIEIVKLDTPSNGMGYAMVANTGDVTRWKLYQSEELAREELAKTKEQSAKLGN